MFTLAVLYRIGVVPQSYRFPPDDPKAMTPVGCGLEESFLPGQIAERSDIGNEERRPKLVIVTESP